jgi:8-oxo-dGTP diphosphatase
MQPRAPPQTPPAPALTVDCVVFGVDEDALQVLLVERGIPPFEGAMALPGGFVHLDESLENAARRELREETGLSGVFLEQLYTFGDLGRDPRGRVVTVAWYALVKLSDHRVRAATDAARAAWYPVDAPPELAFDHERVLAMALDRLRGKLRYAPLGFELLPEKFTLSQLQHLYEMVLGRPLDKRNFRKKLLAMAFLVDTGELQRDVSHRAAKLYAFDRRRYERLQKKGIHFEL